MNSEKKNELIKATSEVVEKDKKLSNDKISNDKLSNDKLSNDKLSLEEYMSKYNSKPVNSKTIKAFLNLIIGTIGLVIIACLFFVVVKLFDLHKIAGYIGIGVSVLIFIFLYLVPITKIKKEKAFVTLVDERNLKDAKKANKALREEIADKMIDFHSKTDNIGWYSSENIGALAIARQTKNDNELKTSLTNIYKTDVKTQANRLIRDHAAKVGLTTAISQSDKLDTLFVTLYDLSLIKELVVLYGYRPSDAKLMKIYRTVLTNALIAFGVESASNTIVTGVMNKLGTATESIPIVGGFIGGAISSASQGLINSSLTILIGFQTKKYLRDEYHYQDILDNVEDNEIIDEANAKEMINEMKKELNKK